jgi:ubiquitin-like 1-activating enzyme E1 B
LLFSPSETAEKPIKGLELDKAPEIPRKPKKEPTVETNVADQPNGKHKLEPEPPSKGLKRSREDDSDPASMKKAKIIATDDVVIVDDDVGIGAITIDDDD